MPEAAPTVGDLVAAFLERCGVTVAFGVISIHNMPILDAFARRNAIRFVPARGEAGAMNMADAAARVRGGLGVVVTSTGTGCANAAGGMVEALTAGSPVLHLTGQIDTPYLDRGRAFLHEAPAQDAMLKAVSKAAFRIRVAADAAGVLRDAVRAALTPPTGPVSVEIPIDVQKATVTWPPGGLEPAAPDPPEVDTAALDRIAARLRAARRPLLWLGGGARRAADAVRRLAGLGVGVVTSVNGRGALPEDHPLSLGAFGMSPPVEALYGRVDAMVVVGSRLRANETRGYALKLPAGLMQIDVDPRQRGLNHPVVEFARGDAAAALDGLARSLAGGAVDPGWAEEIATARAAAEASLARQLGPYAALVEELRAAMPAGALWVRDITLSNSLWGNRLPPIREPRAGVHPLGGGIGQGVPMAIGAALARPECRTLALTGDGGLALCLGELATAAQERANVTFLVMNDGGYGVIRNIQDAQYGGRRHYTELLLPDLGELARLLGMPHWRVDRIEGFGPAAAAALAEPGPGLIEVDMRAIGPFAHAFAGPPAGSGTRAA